MSERHAGPVIVFGVPLEDINPLSLSADHEFVASAVNQKLDDIFICEIPSVVTVTTVMRQIVAAMASFEVGEELQLLGL